MSNTQTRKADHLRICLEEDVQFHRLTNGLEKYRFTHCCLPELEFEEIEPIWKYLCIDSSFIGHMDTTQGTGFYQQLYYDGMEQLRFDAGSFIHEGYLFSLTNVEYDLDHGGYLIEKIKEGRKNPKKNA